MHAGKDSSPPVTSVQHKPLYNINGWLMSWAGTTGTVSVFIIASITVIKISIIQNLQRHHLPTRGDYATVKIITPVAIIIRNAASSDIAVVASSVAVLCGFSDFLSTPFLAAIEYNESDDHYCPRSTLWSFPLPNDFPMLQLSFPVPLH